MSPARSCDAPGTRALLAELARATPRERGAIVTRLVARTAEARSVVLEGLAQGNPTVRWGCVIWVEVHGDRTARAALIPLLHDPKADVRLAVVQAISGGEGTSRLDEGDVVPLLVERAHADESVRVRRQALEQLAIRYAQADLVAFFEERLRAETDAKAHRWAGIGAFLSRQAAG